MNLKNKNITEIVYNSPAEVFIQRHLEALLAQGITPNLIARHNDASYSKSASIQATDNAPLVMPNFDRLSLLEKLFSLRYLIRSNQVSLKKRYSIRERVLLAYFERTRPDLIHFHDASLATLMRWIPENLGIPYTLSLRGSDVQVRPLNDAGYSRLLSATVSGAAGVHSVCDALWATLKQKCPEATDQVFHSTIYTTVPISDIPLQLQGADDKDSGLNFVSVGRLHWRKAYTQLLFGFKGLVAQGIEATLHIIGGGSEGEGLQYWIEALGLSSHVRLVGKLDNRDLRKYLSRMDGYIQSSIAEGFSNATAEALAAGLPVFATAVGGTAEIIQDGINGYLLDPFQPHEWWRKLILARDTHSMNEIRLNAWNTAREYFSVERHAREFCSFYAQAMHEN